MELFQYAMAIIKTFTQYSIWLHHWKVDSYPEQFLFLSRNTRHGHVCTALPGREVSARPAQGPTAGRKSGGRAANLRSTQPASVLGALVTHAPGLFREGKPAQIQPPHTSHVLTQHFSKPTHCSTCRTTARGSQSPQCSEAPSSFSCPLLTENYCFQWLP